MKPPRRVVLASFLLQLAGLPGPSSQSPDDRPLLEAVIRYEIGVFLEESKKSRAAGPTTYCVHVRAAERDEPVDPDPSLLVRFRDIRPPVKPGSACTVKDWKVYDRSSGKRAVILDVGPVVRGPRASEAEVSGAPYAGGQVAREYVYRLVLKGKSWIVRDVQLKIVT